MLRMRTMIALSAGYAVGYMAGTGSAGAMLAQAKSTIDRLLGETGLTEAGQQLADAGREVARDAGARTRGVVMDAASDVADRMTETADAGSDRADDDRADDDRADDDQGVTVAPTPAAVKARAGGS